jgi:hypothetical protein
MPEARSSSSSSKRPGVVEILNEVAASPAPAARTIRWLTSPTSCFMLADNVGRDAPVGDDNAVGGWDG